MKSLGGLAVVLLLLSATVPCRAQSEAFARELADLTVATATVVGAAREASETSEGLGFYDQGWCIFGALLRSGQSISLSTRLDRGIRYLFVAGGGKDAVDVDVEVRDSEGVRLASDTKTDRAAVAILAPSSSGTYSVVVRMYRAQGTAACTLVLLKEGGGLLSADQLAEGLKRFLVGAASLEAVHSKDGDHLTLDHSSGSWVFYGAVLGQDEAVTYRGLEAGSGRLVAFACGDESARDIDAFVLDTRNDSVLGKDTDDDPTPIVSVSTRRGGRYGLKVSAHDCKGKSLVLAAAFKVK